MYKAKPLSSVALARKLTTRQLKNALRSKGFLDRDHRMAFNIELKGRGISPPKKSSRPRNNNNGFGFGAFRY